MFKESDGTDFGVKLDSTEGGKPKIPEKKPWVRLRSTNLSPHANPRNRTQCRGGRRRR